MPGQRKEPRTPDNAQPATYETVRAAILVSLDFTNLDMDFPRIVHWLRQLPATDRDRVLNDLETLTTTPTPRQNDATYLLNDLGLRRIHWPQP
ncbi:hypothetical protein [Kitasatospora sp. NPDC001547]|uniref:hypothetical protein n=1 Tax=Kitasatospora sp. NPDC001547 TaxID=3364015 RepID=UPI003678D2F3